MTVKLVKVGVAAVPGIADIAEEYFDVDPWIFHATRGAEFGIGLIGSLLAKPKTLAEDALEALMLSSEPLLIKSVYELITGVVAGMEKKEAIELKLKEARARREAQLRPEEMRPQLR